jgi:hypothetical protein
MEDKKTTALAVQKNFLEPQTLQEAMQLSNSLAMSTLLPTDLTKNPSNVLLMIMSGRDLGLTATQSIRGIHIIKGRPTLSADLTIAVCQKSGLCEYFICVSSDEKEAVYETKRRGMQPKKLSYTIAEAQRANLISRDTWRLYPAQMLRARCVTGLARMIYSDLLFGCYEYDELVDEQDLSGSLSPLKPEPQQSETKPESIKAESTVEKINKLPDPPTVSQQPVQEVAATAVIEGEIITPAKQEKSLEEMFKSAQTEEELEALTPLLKKQPEPGRQWFREQWAKRLAEVRGAKQATEEKKTAGKVVIRDEF